MKQMNKYEHKKVMIEILEYFDKICRKNNIKYSLIGGSLIGAIRHKGIIPRDDDIDVIMTRENYKKVIDLLEKNKDQKYRLLTYDTCHNYHFPFAKLININTFVIEPQSLTKLNEYGVFIDIFLYTNLPNNEKQRIRFVKKIKLLNSLLSRKKLDFKKESVKQNTLRFLKNVTSYIIGYKTILKFLNHEYVKAESYNSDYVVSNWPIYRIEQEIQLKKSINNYINTKFENHNIMIFEDYDLILRTTFDNYMKVPSLENQISHGLKAFWRQ